MIRLSLTSLATVLGVACFAPNADACWARRGSSGCSSCTSGYGGYGYGSSSYGTCVPTPGTWYGGGWSNGAFMGYPQASGYGMQATPAYGMITQPAVPSAMAQPGAMTTPAVPAAISADKPATIIVKVPVADAEVWFEGHPLPQTGKERSFKTPGLVKDKSYTYKVKAKWTVDGKVLEKTLDAAVKAGETTTLEFK